MTCAQCGQPVSESAKFCPSCGQRSPAPGQPAALAAGVSAGPPPVGSSPSGFEQFAISIVDYILVSILRQPPVKDQPLALPMADASRAGFWWRVLAWGIDKVTVGIVGTILLLPLWLIATALAVYVLNSWGYLIFSYGVWYLLDDVYRVVMESSPLQGTLGKLLLGMRVMDVDGRRLTLQRAILRAIGRWVSGTPLGLGFVMVAFTPRKQGFHDFLASTLVVRVRRATPAPPFA